MTNQRLRSPGRRAVRANLFRMLAVAVLAVTSFELQAADISIRVVDFDHPQRRVPGEIVLHRASGGELSFIYEHTEDPNILSMDCGPGDQIQARPASSSYFHSRHHNCRSPIEIKVMSLTAFNSIVKGAEDAQSTDPSRAALLYNEAYARAAFATGIEDRDTYRIKALESAAAALEVPSGVVLDESVNRKVASEDLVTNIRTFQESKALSVTGKLDYQTLRELSGTSVGGYLGSLR